MSSEAPMDRGPQQDALRASVSRLMRGLNHDLKNPLGAAGGYLQLLTEGVLGELTDQQHQTLERVRGLLGDTLDILDDVVTFARASIGELETQPRPTDISALARIAADEMRAAADERGVNLDVEATEQLEPIRTDGDRVSQILRHLLTNAVEHTQQGGNVLLTVETRPAEGGGDAMVALCVADDGPGIAKEDLERIFLEFERLEGSAGAGFGLPLSRALARLLGGELEVESEPGVGSTFTLLIPAR